MEIRILDDSLEEFVFSLEKKTISKVLRTIDLLEQFGEKLSLPHSKKILSNLFELRIHGNQEIRIFYTFYKSQVYLLHGFRKKSKKIPQKEIRIATKKLKRLDSL